ncbi:GGDEF domain-containing phosphodiesterase [Zhongshania sp. BJYM1]|uniref:GGDEF domain-containing phosphodiesterase n=1 Tax=Zhongshania aquatica TaxID=2965069 RepID=UPI0022B3C997|nr:GGDEF domain-containing phosphodiesterase [Marortus sp. BJYM1]
MQRKLSVVLFLAVTMVMGGRGYLSFVKTVSLQQERIKENLSRLEDTFRGLNDRSSKELFRLADQRSIPSEDEISSGGVVAPSLISGIDSIYYLDRNGLVLASAAQDGSSLGPSKVQVANALGLLNQLERPVAVLNCVLQCFQSVFVPIITDDGRELIININRSATLLIQDFYEITDVDIALFEINQSSQNLTVERIYAASNGAKSGNILANILRANKYSSRGSHDFFGITAGGYYSARFFPLSQNDGVISYAAVIQDQRHVRALLLQTVKDIFLSTLITLALILLLISFILKPSLDRLMKLAKILPMLPSGRLTEAKKLLKNDVSDKKYIDEIDTLQYTLGEVVQSLEIMNASVDEHRHELKAKISAITEAKLFNELILDASPLVVIIHDRVGEVRNINKLGRELTGLATKSPTNANINNWVRNENQSKSLSASLLHITDKIGKKYQGQMPFFTEDGQKLYFLWTHTCLYVNDEAHILSMGIDVTERMEAAESLYWLGQHDRITGLLNRSSFTELASEVIVQYRDTELIELVMFDIDEFAIFNDRFGFDSGDRLLNEIAANFVRLLPDGCLLARTGSGEFCALIRHQLSLKQRVKDFGLEKLVRYVFSKDDVQYEVSISVVVDRYDNELSGIDELISNTTSMMSKVKSKARGSVYYATDSEDSGRVSRQEKYHMREQLQSALTANRLVIFYQPILDLSTNSISHCECLVRMLDDEGQFISPVHFLGIAAESGLMPKLDFTVMEKALKQQKMWEESGIHIGLSINITASTLEQSDFETRLADMIDRTDANPARIIFEVVETDALEDLGSARRLLNNFKNVGAKVALDDFGIGFTSFEYVRELPVDYIKIDQSFIRFIHERESDQVLVKSMVEMCHNLGKKVIVEGVENRAAFEIVRDIGVEYVQGYYVCRPMPISALDLSLKVSDF